jgi:hypothetical protein
MLGSFALLGCCKALLSSALCITIAKFLILAAEIWTGLKWEVIGREGLLQTPKPSPHLGICKSLSSPIVVRLRNPCIGHSWYSALVLDVGSSSPGEERVGFLWDWDDG